MDIVIVAGETSGDQLAADLVQQLRAADPSLRFHGIAGPMMRAAGVNAWFDSQSLAVRGYGEVLTALPRILSIKKQLIAKILALKPALYIGVDAPDFNLRIERAVKAQGIRTLHYVCPSFWAWRPERAAKFNQSVDHMLCLFPFEPELLANHNVPATFVGHPLATAELVTADREKLRSTIEDFSAGSTDPIMAVLPGSRVSELNFHSELFVNSMNALGTEFPNLRFLVPLVTHETREIFERKLWQFTPNLAPRVTLLFGHADFALRAADVALVASGTATLEAAMLDCPQVVSYRISAMTHFIVKRKLTLPYVSLPNILMKERFVTELLQKDATVPAITKALGDLIRDPVLRENMQAKYAQIRQSLIPPKAITSPHDASNATQTPGVWAVLQVLQRA
jgi:lipid-A-disaccharide synthase